jgi:hypothetical protein
VDGNVGEEEAKKTGSTKTIEGDSDPPPEKVDALSPTGIATE